MVEETNTWVLCAIRGGSSRHRYRKSCKCRTVGTLVSIEKRLTVTVMVKMHAAMF